MIFGQILEKSSKGMDTNYENLKREEQKLMEFVRKSSWRCWIWVLGVVMVAIFISVYFTNYLNIVCIIVYNNYRFNYFFFLEMILFIRVTKKN